MTPSRRVRAALLSLVDVETQPRTKKLVRLVLLTWVFVTTLAVLPVAGALWGDGRLLTPTPLTPHHGWVVVGQLASLGLAIAGVWPRVTVLLAFGFTHVLFARVAGGADGGETACALLFAYVVAMDTSGARPRRSRGFGRALAIGLSNGAFVAARVQLACAYAVAALGAVASPRWRDGTALYYVLQDVGHPGLAPWLLRHPMFTVLGTYATLAFQLVFPALVWDRRARPWLLAGAIPVHLGLAVATGRPTSALATLVAHVIFLPEAWSELVLARLDRARLAGWSRLVPSLRSSSVSGELSSSGSLSRPSAVVTGEGRTWTLPPPPTRPSPHPTH